MKPLHEHRTCSTTDDAYQIRSLNRYARLAESYRHRNNDRAFSVIVYRRIESIHRMKR